MATDEGRGTHGRDVHSANGLPEGPRGDPGLHYALISPIFEDGYLLLTELRYRLGRESDSEVVLPSRHVSRTHAVIEHRGGGYILRDAGSTNGTFVNGRQVQQVDLRDEDEIGVGPFLIRYQTVHDLEDIRKALARESELKTAKFAMPPQKEPAPAAEGLFQGGKFGEGDLLRLLMHLEQNRRTGILKIAAAGHALTGRIYFVDGEIVRARAGIFKGEDAVRQLATLSEGEYMYDKSPAIAEEDMRVRPSKIFEIRMLEPRPTDRSYDLKAPDFDE